MFRECTAEEGPPGPSFVLVGNYLGAQWAWLFIRRFAYCELRVMNIRTPAARETVGYMPY